MGDERLQDFDELLCLIWCELSAGNRLAVRRQTDHDAATTLAVIDHHPLSKDAFHQIWVRKQSFAGHRGTSAMKTQ